MGTHKLITPQERKLVQAIAEGKNQTEAGLIANPDRSPAAARVWANKALHKATVQEALYAVYEKRGITLDRIIAPFDDGLDATKQNEYTGEVTVDHQTRMSAARTLAGFIGIGKEAKDTGGVTNNYFQVIKEQKNKYGI